MGSSTDLTSSPSRGPRKDRITSPSKSIRSTQVRHITHAHRVKQMHLTNNVESHCERGTDTDKRSTRTLTFRATRATPQTDLFRSSNQFYREGVKRVMQFKRDNASEESVFEEDSPDDEGGQDY